MKGDVKCVCVLERERKSEREGERLREGEREMRTRNTIYKREWDEKGRKIKQVWCHKSQINMWNHVTR